MLCLQCVCHIDLLYPNIHRNFIWIIIEININPDGIINNNLIFPIFLPCLNLLLDYNNLLLDYNNLLPDYNNPIIIYYYYNSRININPSCPGITRYFLPSYSPESSELKNTHTASRSCCVRFNPTTLIETTVYPILDRSPKNMTLLVGTYPY